MNKKHLTSSLPDAAGYFGDYGGRFVSETLIYALDELTAAYAKLSTDDAFQSQLDRDLANYVGRPSPLYHAENLSKKYAGAQIYLKREDLNHTGAHKINNTMGQALLAKYIGKKKIIAETGAGQHGVASATVAARLGLKCKVFMGSKDIQRQSLNVYRMKLLGAEIVPVESGSRTLKDALNEALRYWVSNVDDTFYVIGTVAGPHPYPKIVRDFQAIIGRETRTQMLAQTGKLPDALVACVGGGSNAIGLFYDFIDDTEVSIYGVEAGGKGVDSNQHAAPLTAGSPGVLHGNKTYLMQNNDGQIQDTYSVSAGLDYPGVGPEHSYLKDAGRVTYTAVNDEAALNACRELNKLEGILPALETSHALAYATELAQTMQPDQSIVVNLSGRGDKDILTLAQIDNITM
jgi:tryptophan synthase beta chain